ncbi:HAD family hydrolase [Mycobacterium asiaticum]|uniref:HAD family hydrolase n=1 Tax=Mycobacterium asiaticum TaxID=1790 RepID=A0A1A3NZQ7_MYCAS|nr:HAD family hydrolase [Mycobacterium asiaticum]OBK27421.1 HAD family hydrolase [Mycobacterium asiaticum]
MSALIACDLDRTLIYSDRSFGAATTDRVCVEYYNGSPLSFMTAQAVTGLRALAAGGLVVPATTRTIAQYQRIDLPGSPFRYAVTSNGGNILVDSVADADWSAGMASRINDGGPPLQDIVAALQDRISSEWVHSLRVAEDLFCYLVVVEDKLPRGFVDDWAGWCAERGWVVSRQGRKIYAVPEALRKSYAVAEVRRRLADEGRLSDAAPLLAAGDGALDVDLLSYADQSIRPAHGELHALDWRSPELVVTAASGAAAAEEILAWLAKRAGVPSRSCQ